MKLPANRKGFIKKVDVIASQIETLEHREKLQPLVYWNSKLTHTGIIAYKSFENIYRKSNQNSLNNLINQGKPRISEVKKWLDMWRIVQTNKIKRMVLQVAESQLFEYEIKELNRMVLNKRTLSVTQSRKLKNEANKLSYYSGRRYFTSKKSGKYTMKTAFITLTAPDGSDELLIKKAFDSFCQYLTRTANCVYVWKKELGENNNKFHVHILINNFIPYYIVAWKWRKCLNFEGISLPITEKGKESNAHSRIELPRNAKQVNYYISKYMSKAYAIPRTLGYIWGESAIMKELKEVVLIENDIDMSEVAKLKACCKVICDQFITIICVNLYNAKDFVPNIHAVFEQQFIDFTQRITLPQKFFVV